MKTLAIFLFTISVVCVLGLPKTPRAPAAPCSTTVCKEPQCRCTSIQTPGGIPAKSTPQLVFMTFDDDVNTLNYPQYMELFNGRVNPDGCQVTTTYFVSHEYTDYDLVNDLYSRGHEIALHSVTHNYNQDYWRNLAVPDQEQEYGGNREILFNFGNVSQSDVQGMRIPQLALSGDNSFQALHNLGMTWDCSWPTHQMEPAYWPYTLDYASKQDCTIEPCPTSSFPGTWVVPMTMLDYDGQPCSMVDGCWNIPDDTQGIFDFIIENFNKQYKTTKAPFGFYMHSAWFGQRENSFAAYVMFLDYLATLSDVYIVNISRGLRWVQNPQPLDKLEEVWPSCEPLRPKCTRTVDCELNKGEEKRYMTACGIKCPAVYPWLGNPLGLA